MRGSGRAPPTSALPGTPTWCRRATRRPGRSPPFGGEIRDGLLYGRGAVDMKGAVACFVAAALKHLADHGGNPERIAVAAHHRRRGRPLDQRHRQGARLAEGNAARRLDACLVGEPSCQKALGDEIKIGRRGSLNGELIVKGKQGHAAYPHIADNPIPKLARIIDRLAALKLDEGTEQLRALPHRRDRHLGAEHGRQRHSGAGARALSTSATTTPTRARSIEKRLAQCCKAAAEEVGAKFTLTFSGTGDVFLTKPGPLVDGHGRGRARGDGAGGAGSRRRAARRMRASSRTIARSSSSGSSTPPSIRWTSTCPSPTLRR